MFANFDLIPPGASAPLIKPRSIDDVPILALTLWSKRYGDYELRRLAAQLHDTIKQVDQVSAVAIIGGQRRQVRVDLDEARLAGYHLSPADIAGALGAANRRLPAASFSGSNREFLLEAGSFLTCADDVRRVVVGVADSRPVFLGDVARIEDGGEEPSQYVRYASAGDPALWPAVTLAVSKRKGANAIGVADRVLARVDAVRGSLLPADVQLSITRNYGETAAEKSNELLFHMLIAVISVAALIWLTLGLREAGIVFIAIPVTLALTLATFYLYGFTLNRITLFALIFSIGILVDDAIVIVENIVRHARLPHNQGRSLAQVAVEAVDEVGNPTILATLAVIAAILPIAFVSGLSGPYMRPIPVGASAAMVFSLVVALVVTPWAAVRLLSGAAGHSRPESEDRLTRLYRRVMRPLLHHTAAALAFWRWSRRCSSARSLSSAFGFVKVKMLPFDNKSEFQVIIDMPEGTTLEETARVAERTGRRRPEAARGCEPPDLRRHRLALQLQRPGAALLSAARIQRRRYPGEPRRQIRAQAPEPRYRQARSRAVDPRSRGAPEPASKSPKCRPARRCSKRLSPRSMARRSTANSRSRAQIRNVFEKTPGVVDVDWYVEDDQPKYRIRLDREKAALNGITGPGCGGHAAPGERGRFRWPAPRLRGERRRTYYSAPRARLAFRSRAPEEPEVARHAAAAWSPSARSRTSRASSRTRAFITRT